MKRLLGSLAAIAGLLPAAPVAAQTSASPYTYGTRYDAAGRVTGTIAPDPDSTGSLKYAAVRKTYDGAGRVTKVEKGELSTWKSETVAPSAWGASFTVLESVETIYDTMGRKSRETAKGSGGVAVSVTQYSYDNVGRLQCSAVRMNAAVFGSLPASACTLGTQGSDGPDRITKNVYDAASQLQQVREGVGVSGVEAAEATYTYTLNGKRDYLIDANGNRARFIYDGHDRLSQWQFPSTTRPTGYNDSTPATALATAGAVNTADYEQYGYDLASNRTSLRKRDARSIGYTYDALNRMTVKDIPGSTTLDVYYGYDLRGLQTYARFASTSGQGVTQGWDGFGRLSSSATNQGGTTRTLTYLYDRDGDRIRLTWPDSNYVTFDYDGLDRMITVKQSGTTSIATYTYNPRTDIASRTNGAETSTYGYDPIGRSSSIFHDLTSTASDVTLSFSAYNAASQLLTRSVSNDTYAYTPVGNANQAYTTNGLNQYNAVAGTTYGYDANGNLTSDGSTTYGYDVENRLTSGSGAKVGNLVYDPLGRLFETSGAAGANLTRLLYDGSELVAEYDGAGTMLRRFVHGSGIDRPIVWYEGAALTTRRHLLANEQGSPIAVIDSIGALVQANAWDEYGLPKIGNLGRFGYAGQIYIPELGLWHYKARAYSPALGRFMQTDPVGYEDEINLYEYVGDDPVDYTDPTGLYVCRGTREECAAIDEYVKGVRDAAKAAQAKDRASAAAKALNILAGLLGSRGEANGLILQNAAFTPGVFGDHGPDVRGGSIITLDLMQIARTGGAAGTGTVVHELAHRVQELHRGQPKSLADVYQREHAANTIESLAYEYLGQSDRLWSPRMSPKERSTRINEAARLSCEYFRQVYGSRAQFAGQTCPR